MNDNMIVSVSPHIRSTDSTTTIMRDVLIGLAPAVVASVLFFGIRALLVEAFCVACCMFCEWLFEKGMKRPSTVGDLSAAVTGLMLAMNLPVSIPLGQAAIGCVVAIIVVRQLFGGIGHNFANPALTGRIVMFLAFSSTMATWAAPNFVDAVSGATPLAILKDGTTEGVNVLHLFLGAVSGSLGETSAAALLLGGLYMMVRKVISWHIPVTYIATVFVFCLIKGGFQFAVAEIFAGSLFLCAFFMATDYVTSPVSRLGQFIYGCLIGVLGGVFRLYGNTADSFSYAIIIGNVCTPLIDTYIVQKPLAYRKIGKTRPVKREPFRIPKPVIALTLIAAIAGVALSGVYSMTKGTIDLQELQKKTAAYKEVCPEAETFELVDAAEELIAKQDEKASPKINEFYVGKTADGQVAGYAASVTAKGFGGDVTMALGLTPDGAVRKIAFTELNETAGLGMEADKAPFKDQFTGRSGELSLIKGTASGEQEISALTGATVTSTAVVNGVNAGLAFCEEATKGGN